MPLHWHGRGGVGNEMTGSSIQCYKEGIFDKSYTDKMTYFTFQKLLLPVWSYDLTGTISR